MENGPCGGGPQSKVWSVNRYHAEGKKLTKWSYSDFIYWWPIYIVNNKKEWDQNDTILIVRVPEVPQEIPLIRAATNENTEIRIILTSLANYNPDKAMSWSQKRNPFLFWKTKSASQEAIYCKSAFVGHHTQILHYWTTLSALSSH